MVKSGCKNAKLFFAEPYVRKQTMTGSNDNRNLMSDINVTPFVDVMLVLLIIFMVAAPMMMQGVDVSLPETSSEALSADREPLIVSVDKTQQIFINDYKVKLDGLQSKLGKIREQNPAVEVFLRADKDVSYGTVVLVMSEIKKAGIEQLGIVTEPVRAKKGYKSSDN
jgi:biopolymer transport protein TolR